MISMRRNQDITRAIEQNRSEILAFLTEMVNCNSYTLNVDGVNQVAEMVAAEMPTCFEHEVIEVERFADHHRFSHKVGAGLPILMAGHIDTLCPRDSPFNKLTEQGDKLLGPGVNDMKGGITVLVWSLKILEELGLLDDLSVVCIINGDEEFGSQSSHALFTEMKGRVRKALVFECGGPEGTVVTTRKGVMRRRIDFTGKAAHHGCMKGRKVSAIEELAHKALAIESMNRADDRLRTNVGLVEGGLNPNKVAEKASLAFEMRYWTKEAGEEALQAVRDLIASPTVEGCTMEMSEISYRPPLQPSAGSMELFERVREIGKNLDQTIIEEKRGGVSDANWLSHVGIPVIDGLGPIGDLDFTEDEYIIKKALFERVELTTHVLLHLKGK